MDDNGLKETHALHNMREALTCANVEIQGLKKELDAMTADRDRFAKLSEEWALKGVKMREEIDRLKEMVKTGKLMGNPCKHYKYGHDCSQENEFHCGKKPCTIDFGEAYE